MSMKSREKGGHNKENSSSLLRNFQKKLRLDEDGFKKRKPNDAFVQRVNGYIETISSQNRNKNNKGIKGELFEQAPRKESSKSRLPQSRASSFVKKLKAEKEVNKNLQKCLIEIQKMLWERNERLEALEEELSSVEKLRSRQNSEQSSQASEESMAKIRASEGNLKRYANSLGLKKILNSLNNQQIEQASQASESKQSPSDSSCSLDYRSRGYQNPYIKIQRPRTESQSEVQSRRRK